MASHTAPDRCTVATLAGWRADDAHHRIIDVRTSAEFEAHPRSLLWSPARFLSGAVGAGLVAAALTNNCAMGMLLAKLPYNRATPSCDVDTIVGQLTGRR